MYDYSHSNSTLKVERTIKIAREMGDFRRRRSLEEKKITP